MTDRTEKFRRVLPRLTPARSKYQAGETIAVRVVPPISELCDVTLCLVHESGRTYAQKDLQLGPETGEIVLRDAINIPEGRYEVVATPPLKEFWSTTPVKHRMPLSVFAATTATGLVPMHSKESTNSMIEQHFLPAEPITSGAHHFFGYYDKFPWNASGRLHLGLQTTFLDRQPTRDDVAVIGVIDTENGNAWTPVAETTAWCWQQGTMAQWLPSEPEHTIVYNIRQDDRFYGIIHDLRTGEKRRLSRAVYAIGQDYALSLNFARLDHIRPGYGYADGAENNLPDPHPADDGVFRIDLATGENELLVSLQRLFETNTIPRMHAGPHWVNHLTVSPEGSNFVFLNRCQFDSAQRFNDRFYRSSADGHDLRLVHDNTYFSHFGYRDEHTIVAYARTPGTEREQYALYDLCEDRFEVIGAEVFSSDGHCSFSPDRRWMLTDTYPDERNERTLILYEMATGRRVNIGRFYSLPELKGELRCDLHPRWSRDGRKVSLDSAHTGERQIFTIDVSSVVG